MLLSVIWWHRVGIYVVVKFINKFHVEKKTMTNHLSAVPNLHNISLFSNCVIYLSQHLILYSPLKAQTCQTIGLDVIWRWLKTIIVKKTLVPGWNRWSHKLVTTHTVQRCYLPERCMCHWKVYNKNVLDIYFLPEVQHTTCAQNSPEKKFIVHTTIPSDNFSHATTMWAKPHKKIIISHISRKGKRRFV